MTSRTFILGRGASLALVAAVACRTGESGAPGASTAPSSVAASASVAATASTANVANAAATRLALPAHTGAVKPHGTAQPVVAFSDPSTATREPTVTPTLTPTGVGLPTVDFGAPGPMVIHGYPQALGTGMRDYATYMGYSKDGKTVVACGHMTPMSPPSGRGVEKGNECFVDDGVATKNVGLDASGESPFVGPALAAALTTLKEGYPHDLVFTPAAATLMPPPLVATWRYARDIALQVSGSGNILKFGGQYAKEEVVYPVSLSAKSSSPDLQFPGDWNGILQNPAGDELALLGHFFCMEWCNDVVITRLSHDRIASYVYNDTGFRHHKAKEYTASRDLFLKATWANPKAPLPPYNLACAYALLGDATNAEKALRLAIAVAGDKVKARAKKDADFKSVLGAKWFKDLTG